MGPQEPVWLSILVPVYNAERFLPECADSIMPQALAAGGVEVILCDDRSTDGSWQIMQQLRKRYGACLRLLRHAVNQGVSVARNTLLDDATGNYVWFMDADDKLAPQAVAAIRDVLRRFAPDLLMFDFRVLRERTRLKHRLRGEGHRRTFRGPSFTLVRDISTLLSGLFLAGQFHPWSKVARRACWGYGSDGVRFPPGQLFAEDMATISRLALRVESAVYLPEALVLYRQHGGNVMASMNAQKIRGLSSALRGFSAELQERRKPLDAGTAFAVSHVSARNYMGAMRFLAAHPQQAEGGRLAQEFRRNYLETSPLPPHELLNAYLRRGWWLRYWRARRWLGARRLATP